MSVIKPFKGLRPPKRLAEKLAAPPYDVLNREEAKTMAAGNPHSFLHINKPEIDIDDSIDAFDQCVYQRGAENLRSFREQGFLCQDARENFYVYQQIMGDHQQVGLVAAASVEEYEKDLIKKHEFTRPDKEDDRVNHMATLNAQVGPVFLTYQANNDIDAIIAEIVKAEPEYNFTSRDGIRHILWVVDDQDKIATIKTAFARIPCLYVADGHHRSAAAMRVKQQKQAANPNHTGEESYNFFLAVIFPHNQMKILDYNRVVKDLNGHSEREFLERIAETFDVTTLSDKDSAKPQLPHHFGMCLNGQWFGLQAKPNTWDDDDPVQRLDVSILQNNLLAPILGIANPRTDKRIDFVGGIRGMAELEKRGKSGQWLVAFALFPTSIENLMAIADAGEVMPPKSTWFEPKLRSGLVVHCLD
jgi:uncharacterized protein (DUF1015 family)